MDENTNEESFLIELEEMYDISDEKSVNQSPDSQRSFAEIEYSSSDPLNTQTFEAEYLHTSQMSEEHDDALADVASSEKQLTNTEPSDECLNDLEITENPNTSIAHSSSQISLPCSETCKNEPNDPLTTLLISWNMRECHDILEAKKITVESLKCLRSKHLDEIFGENIGMKAVFENKLSIWQNNLSLNSPTLPFNVRTVLEQCEEGNRILNSYAHQKLLEPLHRTEIVRRIIQCYIETNVKITIKMFKEIAKEIVNIFPNENIDTYFTQDKKTKKPKGKLYDRYYTRKRTLRKLDPKENNIEPQERQKINVTNEFDKENLESVRVELKYIREWDLVLEKWQVSMPLRFEEIKSKPLSEVLQRWPLYKYPRSADLVDIDFNALFGKKFDFQMWEKLCNILPVLFETRLRAPLAKMLYSDLNTNRENIDIENTNFYLLKLLHAILPPLPVRQNERRIKYTIADSQRAFCIEVQNATDIDNVVLEDSHPVIFAIGNKFNLKQFIVSFESSKFTFSTYLSAVDFCFKLAKIFNLKHDEKCSNIWIFIQKFCYGFPVEPNNPNVETLIHDIYTRIYNDN